MSKHRPSTDVAAAQRFLAAAGLPATAQRKSGSYVAHAYTKIGPYRLRVTPDAVMVTTDRDGTLLREPRPGDTSLGKLRLMTLAEACRESAELVEGHGTSKTFGNGNVLTLVEGVRGTPSTWNVQLPPTQLHAPTTTRPTFDEDNVRTWSGAVLEGTLYALQMRGAHGLLRRLLEDVYGTSKVHWIVLRANFPAPRIAELRASPLNSPLGLNLSGFGIADPWQKYDVAPETVPPDSGYPMVRVLFRPAPLSPVAFLLVKGQADVRVVLHKTEDAIALVGRAQHMMALIDKARAAVPFDGTGDLFA